MAVHVQEAVKQNPLAMASKTGRGSKMVALSKFARSTGPSEMVGRRLPLIDITRVLLDLIAVEADVFDLG